MRCNSRLADSFLKITELLEELGKVLSEQADAVQARDADAIAILSVRCTELCSQIKNSEAFRKAEQFPSLEALSVELDLDPQLVSQFRTVVRHCHMQQQTNIACHDRLYKFHDRLLRQQLFNANTYPQHPTSKLKGKRPLISF